MTLQNLLNGKAQTITAAAVLIGSTSLISRLLGVLRDRLLVGAFGVGDELDAYYASFQIPNLLFNLLIIGTLSAAFIPVWSGYWHKDREQCWTIANSVLNATLIVMGSLSLVLLIFTRPLMMLVSPGFDGEKMELTVTLSRIMLLSPVLLSASSVFSSILNATKRFVAVSVAPIIYNLSIIASILVAGRSFGVGAVTVGVLTGALLHMAIEAVAAGTLGYRYSTTLNLEHPGVRTIGRLFLPRIIGIDVSQMSLFVGTIVGSLLAAGSVALYNLVVNIQSVPIGVVAIPYALAAFPTLAEATATRNHERFQAALSYTIRQMLFFLIPLTLFTIVLRAHVIRLVIGTRQLSWDDTRLAAAALAIFALSFIFQGAAPLFARAFYAQQDTVRPVIASIVAIVVNILATLAALALLATPGGLQESARELLRLQGIEDIRVLALPVGFVVSVVANSVLLGMWFYARHHALEVPATLWRLGKIVVASGIAASSVYGTLQLMVPLVNTRTFMGILGQMAVATIVGAVVYTIVSLFTRSQEMWQFLRSLKRRMDAMVGPIDLHEAEEL